MPRATPARPAAVARTPARAKKTTQSEAPPTTRRTRAQALADPADDDHQQDKEQEQNKEQKQEEEEEDDNEDGDSDADESPTSASSAGADAADSASDEDSAADEDDEFDMSALIAQASTALASKLTSGPPASASASRKRPTHSRVVESTSDLNDLFGWSRNGSATSARPSAEALAAASVPAGFVRKNGVLHLTAGAEAAAAVQTSDAPMPAAQVPDLLAAIGSSSKLDVFNPVQQRKAAAKGAQLTAGAGWFNFSRPSVITKEMKRDLQLLSLRAYMDPKKFFKKESKKKKIVPTFFQMGTVIAGAQDFYSSRLNRAERSQHYVDDFVNPLKKRGEVKKVVSYLKRKTIEVQKANQPAPRFFNKKRKQIEDASKRGASKKKART